MLEISQSFAVRAITLPIPSKGVIDCTETSMCLGNGIKTIYKNGSSPGNQ